MKKLYIIIIIIFSVVIVSDVFAYNITGDLFIAQSYNNNSWISNTTQSSQRNGLHHYNINNSSVSNQLRLIYNQQNAVDLTTTGYTTYDLAVFQINYANNSLSAGSEAPLSISAFGNVCYTQINSMFYGDGQEMNVRAYCPGNIPNNWGYTANIITMNYNAFTMSYLEVSDVTLFATNGAIFNSLNDIKNYLQNNNNNNVVNAINSQTQQQAQQHQDFMNTDTSQQGSNFQSQVNNFSVPDDTGAFNMFGSLQSLLTNISISGACTRVQVPIPFVSQSVTLPCMTTDVYSVHFPQIVVLWQLIVRGIAYYYIIVNFIRLIKETIDPFSMKLEVLDL